MKDIVTYPLLGNGRGYLGNQLFEIASVAGIAKRIGSECVMPSWAYEKYFNPGFVKFSNAQYSLPVKKEKGFEYDSSLIDNGSYAVDGWLQSPLYWDNDRDFIRNEVFPFRKEFLQSLPHVPSGTIAVHIRRGDYVANSAYHLLNIDYYIKAMSFYGSGTKFIVFGNDRNYLMHHFNNQKNISIAPDLNPIEHIALMSKCDGFIIANSTFSWWGAYLSKSNLVHRPSVHFHGPLASEYDWKDYYPSNWSEVDCEAIFPNVAFTIPVSYDHPDREQNLRLSLAYIKRFFPEAKIIVAEQGIKPMFKWVKEYNATYLHYAFMKDFHRTKMLNDMAKKAIGLGCDVVVNYDADVILPPMQMYEAIKAAKDYGMVFPYDGRFARVPRRHYMGLMDTLDTGILAGNEFPGMQRGAQVSVGGCVVWDANMLHSVGYENENFVSYGPEDVERVVRFRSFTGREPYRVSGTLYHVDHFVGKNSSSTHEFFESNNLELERVKRMDKTQIKEYIKTWAWAK